MEAFKRQQALAQAGRPASTQDLFIILPPSPTCFLFLSFISFPNLLLLNQYSASFPSAVCSKPMKQGALLPHVRLLVCNRHCCVPSVFSFLFFFFIRVFLFYFFLPFSIFLHFFFFLRVEGVVCFASQIRLSGPGSKWFATG